MSGMSGGYYPKCFCQHIKQELMKATTGIILQGVKNSTQPLHSTYDMSRKESSEAVLKEFNQTLRSLTELANMKNLF